MFWIKPKPRKPAFPMGSLRIVPGWDGLYHIEKYDLDFLSLASGRIVERWEGLVGGFQSYEEAVARIEFMGRQDRLIGHRSEAETAERLDPRNCVLPPVHQHWLDDSF